MNTKFDDDFLNVLEDGDPVSLTDACSQVFRPGFDALENGTYRSRILDTEVFLVKEQPKLKIKAEFYNEDGDFLVERCQAWLDWKPNSPSRSFLEATDALPDPRAPLLPELTYGKEVLLTIRINERNGNSFINLVKAEAIRK